MNRAGAVPAQKGDDIGQSSWRYPSGWIYIRYGRTIFRRVDDGRQDAEVNQLTIERKQTAHGVIQQLLPRKARGDGVGGGI